MLPAIRRLPLLGVAVATLSFLVLPGPCAGQDRGSPQTAKQSGAAPAPGDAKPKKVWTNDNLAQASGTVSVVGDAKGPARSKDDRPADPTYVANVKKQLAKLNAQLVDADKQLVELKNFNSGEPGTNLGRQLHKGYNTEPVDQQIKKLGEQKKETWAKIDALLDEARKKGVLPGQLR
ncbi:MAG TPA: hypothetical protein VK525_08080 [Candidatus Saccharimonadales bacterium]|nr:hypothetical protein [Candidatus Saccharimonadales bacterium]